MCRVSSILALMLVWLISAPAFAQKAGDCVVVLHMAQVKIGDDVLQTLPPGQHVAVFAVQGEWLWVSRETTGWLARHDVAAPPKAIEFFSERIGRNRCDVDAFVARGNAKVCDGQFDAAIEDYNEALRLDRQKIAAWTNRGVAWTNSNRLDLALADFDEALRLDRRSTDAWFLRGTLRAQTGLL